MKKILITGGPVHTHLDAVKIITNKFKGGLMAELADDLLAKEEIEIHYVVAKKGAALPSLHKNKVHTYHLHDGFEDYFRAVILNAPQMDAVILGAAVANLIPVKPFEGKFPSHNYKPGDIIPIDFTIAPRVIDEVKKVAPKTHLFGFKLLSGVPHEELIRAAYEIVLDSRATAVFANDEKKLSQVYAVTKERGVHPLQRRELASWVWEMINDEYFSTVSIVDGTVSISGVGENNLKTLIDKFRDKFVAVENGMIFGTVAVRDRSLGGFITTGRGKRELESIVIVRTVDTVARAVFTLGGKKASFNAPLLAKIFENPKVDHIVHYHQQEPNLLTLPYAPPGTVRDTNRPNSTSFNIEGHGCMLLFDKDGRQL